MAAKTKKKRKASPAQLAALARGRKKLAAKKPKSRVKKTSKPKAKKSVQSKIVVIQPQEKKTMARKKSSTVKTAKKSSSGRKRVANFAGKAKGMIPVVKEVAMAVAGGVGAGVLANKLPVANPKVKAAIPVVAGLVLAGVLGKKKPLLKEIGAGMAVVGAIGLIKQFMPNVPVLAGEDVIYIPESALPNYAGDPLQIGYDEDSDDFMGDMMDLGYDDQEEYLSPASL